MIMPLIEVIVGLAGVILGGMGKANRSTSLIGVGILMQGISHWAHGSWQTNLGFIGEGVVLFALGMMLASLLRRRRR